MEILNNLLNYNNIILLLIIIIIIIIYKKKNKEKYEGITRVITPLNETATISPIKTDKGSKWSCECKQLNI